MSWFLFVDRIVKKKKKRMPKRDAERITFAIKQLVVNPYAGDIEKIEGSDNVWRRRIGSYRIFYEIHTTKKVIYILDVERRTSSAY